MKPDYKHLLGEYRHALEDLLSGYVTDVFHWHDPEKTEFVRTLHQVPERRFTATVNAVTHLQESYLTRARKLAPDIISLRIPVPHFINQALRIKLYCGEAWSTTTFKVKDELKSLNTLDATTGLTPDLRRLRDWLKELSPKAWVRRRYCSGSDIRVHVLKQDRSLERRNLLKWQGLVFGSDVSIKPGENLNFPDTRKTRLVRTDKIASADLILNNQYYYTLLV